MLTRYTLRPITEEDVNHLSRAAVEAVEAVSPVRLDELQRREDASWGCPNGHVVADTRRGSESCSCHYPTLYYLGNEVTEDQYRRWLVEQC